MTININTTPTTKFTTTPTSIQSPTPEQKTYYASGYPVFGFLYALYCDSTVSNAAVQTWQNGSDTYLDAYRMDSEFIFPQPARDIIHIDVPQNGVPTGGGRRRPTSAMALEISPHLLAELTRAPVPDACEAMRTLAFPSADCPVVSMLGVIFLNKQAPDDELMRTYEIADRVQSLLRRVAAAVIARNAPTEEDILELMPSMVAEFTRRSVW
jgi:hypothetical protein